MNDINILHRIDNLKTALEKQNHHLLEISSIINAI